MEDLLPVQRNGKWGYIRPDGELVVPIRHSYCAPFSEGLGWICIGKKTLFINSNAHVIFEGTYPEYGLFQDGMCSFRTKRGYEGFINRAGEVVIQPIYRDASGFSGGLACVARKGKYGFINQQGEEVIPLEFENCFNFLPHGEFTVYKLNAKWGFLDRSGKRVTEPRFDYALPAEYGASLVKESSKWYVVNLSQEGICVVSQDSFEMGDRFNEGLAAVQNDDLWGYVNTKGEMVIPFQFTDAQRFYEGLAAVYVGGYVGDEGPTGGGYGYINPSGELVIAPQFDFGEDFNHGIACVFQGDYANFEHKTGYINTKGEYIWEPTK